MGHHGTTTPMPKSSDDRLQLWLPAQPFGKGKHSTSICHRGNHLTPRLRPGVDRMEAQQQ